MRRVLISCLLVLTLFPMDSDIDRIKCIVLSLPFHCDPKPKGA